MSQNNHSGSSGVGFGTLLFLLFLGLKLGKVITWPWIWVFAPLWIPLAIFLAIVAIVGLGLLFGVGKRREKNRPVRFR